MPNATWPPRSQRWTTCTCWRVAWIPSSKHVGGLSQVRGKWMSHRGNGIVGLFTSQPGESPYSVSLPTNRSQLLRHRFCFVHSGAQHLTNTWDFEVTKGTWNACGEWLQELGSFPCDRSLPWRLRGDIGLCSHTPQPLPRQVFLLVLGWVSLALKVPNGNRSLTDHSAHFTFFQLSCSKTEASHLACKASVGNGTLITWVAILKGGAGYWPQGNSPKRPPLPRFWPSCLLLWSLPG